MHSQIRHFRKLFVWECSCDLDALLVGEFSFLDFFYEYIHRMHNRIVNFSLSFLVIEAGLLNRNTFSARCVFDLDTFVRNFSSDFSFQYKTNWIIFFVPLQLKCSFYYCVQSGKLFALKPQHFQWQRSLNMTTNQNIH